MKKLIVLFLFFTITILGQHTWSVYNLVNSGYRINTGFTRIGDSLYFSAYLAGGNSPGSLERISISGGITENEMANAWFGNLSYSQGYIGGSLFAHDSCVYTIGIGEVNNGSFWSWQNNWFKGNVYTQKYITLPGLITDQYTSPTFLQTNISVNESIIKDTLFIGGFLAGNSWSAPAGNYMYRYNLATDAQMDYRPVLIPEFNTPAGKAGQRVILSLFSMGDTLYALTGYGNVSLVSEDITQLYDTTASLWKRNTDYTWTDLKNFTAGNVFSTQYDSSTNAEYFLLIRSDDSTNTDAGVWKFDGTNITQVQKPPSLCRVVGFYVSGNSIFESVASSGISDSNKVYFYNGTSWDSGERIYSSVDANYMQINNIYFMHGQVYLSYKYNLSSFGTGSTRTVARSDTSFYYLTINKPIAGYYQQPDSLDITWITNKITDSIQVYINYDSLSTWHLVYAGTNVDSIRIYPDSLSSHAFVKILNITRGLTAISTQFNITYIKLLIKNVTITPSSEPGVNIYASMVGVSTLLAYYSTDSINWNYYATYTISNQNYHFETLSSNVSFPIAKNCYFKLSEPLDTTVYGLSSTVVNSYSPVYQPGSPCKNWVYNGLGATWLYDPGCGWVNCVLYTYQSSSVTIDNYGNPTVINGNPSYYKVASCSTSTDPPGTIYIQSYLDLPKPTGVSGFQNTKPSSPVTIAGRQYWWINNVLYMHDVINNITYPILNLGYSLSGASFDSTAGVAQNGNYLLFASSSYPYVIIVGALPYPPVYNHQPLSSTYHLTGSVSYAYYENSFRGIYPKALKTFNGPVGY